MEDTKDPLGDRMKGYEAPTTQLVAQKGKPLIVRLDGKAFSSFTKGLPKPYDRRLLNLMVDTTRFLVDYFHARVGYVQSDEISLGWFVDDSGSTNAEYLFGGRIQKLQSLIAAKAAVYFNSRLAEVLPEKAGQLPIFDARAFQTPDLLEAYHAFLWRQMDCKRNAVSITAHTFYGHKKLMKVNTQDKIKLINDLGTPFENYAEDFRIGTFIRRVPEVRELTAEELAQIPEKFWPTGPVTRTALKTEVLELLKLSNPIEYLFKAAEPLPKEEA